MDLSAILVRKRQLVARAAVCGTILSLSACQIPGLRNAQTGPTLPENFAAIGSGAPNPYPNPEGIAALAGAVVGYGAVPPSALTTGGDTAANVGIDEFYNDAMLSRLIHDALAGNQELKMMDEEIQIAANEVLSRRGAYLPFVGVRAGAGLERPSLYTRDGAVEEQLLIAPGRTFPDPLPDYYGALSFLWRLDIWREYRNARDAARLRYLAAIDRRNFFVTRLVAETAENYYTLMALDKRLENLDTTIALQEKSLEIAKAKKEAGRGTELAVQRFLAEVRKNQSEKLVVKQEMIEVENRINFLLGRYPQTVERPSAKFFDLTFDKLTLGVPAQLLQNRPDVRRAEREVAAAGLDVLVARAHFFPSLDITANVGYRAFNPRYLFNPEALVYNAAGDLAAPLINKKAIQAEFLTANARQLQALYDYQRTVLNAYTEVINRVSMAENYRKSLRIKKQQLDALDESIAVASQLFQNARAEYVEVLLAQRDYMDAKMEYINIKRQQLAAVVNTYQALGGGDLLPPPVVDAPKPLLRAAHPHK